MSNVNCRVQFFLFPQNLNFLNTFLVFLITPIGPRSGDPIITTKRVKRWLPNATKTFAKILPRMQWSCQENLFETSCFASVNSIAMRKRQQSTSIVRKVVKLCQQQQRFGGLTTSVTTTPDWTISQELNDHVNLIEKQQLIRLITVDESGCHFLIRTETISCRDLARNQFKRLGRIFVIAKWCWSVFGTVKDSFIGIWSSRDAPWMSKSIVNNCSFVVVQVKFSFSKI